MAAMTLDLLRAPGNGLEVIIGSFAPAGTGVPTTVYGRGFTVTWVSTGLYLVTLENKYTGLIAADATIQLAVAADLKAQIGTVVMGGAATNTVQIRSLAIGAVTDIAANAGNRVNFVLMLKRSSTKDGTGL